jgi:hypothetical protein
LNIHKPFIRLFALWVWKPLYGSILNKPVYCFHMSYIQMWVM